MRHRIKKIKFKLGRDANKMLSRKLASNFLLRNKIVTTLKKAQVLKSQVERLVEKSKKPTEANKNYLLRFLGNIKLTDRLFKEVGPLLKDKSGGYVRIVKMGQRDSDGSNMARLEWVYPVVLETEEKKKTKNQTLENRKKVIEVGK